MGARRPKTLREKSAPSLSVIWLVALLLLLVSAGTASAQSGFILVAPGTGRPNCTDIAGPITNQTWCADGNPPYAWKVWNGTTYVTIAGGGGGGGVSGSGTPPQLPVWTAATTLGSLAGITGASSMGLTIAPTANPAVTNAAFSIQQSSIATGNRQFLAALGLTAGLGNNDQVGLYVGVDATPTGLGNAWSLNSVMTLEPGVAINAAQGYEIDLNNLTATHRDGFAPPVSYGLSITGASTSRNTAGILITGVNATQWEYGIAFAGAPPGAIHQASIFDDTAGAFFSYVAGGSYTSGFVFSGTASQDAFAVSPAATVVNGLTIGANTTGAAIAVTGTPAGLNPSLVMVKEKAASGVIPLCIDSSGNVLSNTTSGGCPPAFPASVGASGEITLTGASTTATITLPFTAADTSYAITLGTRSVSGTPPAVLVWVTAKTVTTFDVELTAAPGGGNTVAVDWAVGGGTPGAGIGGSGTPNNIMVWNTSNTAKDLASFSGSPCGAGTAITAISAAGVVTCTAFGGGSVTTTGSPANGNLTQFSGASSITNGDLSGDVTTSGTLATTLAGRYKIVSFCAPIGDPGAGSPVLANDNDQPASLTNRYGADLTVTTVSCTADTTTGTPQADVKFSGGASILTGVINCGAQPTYVGGTLSGTPVVHSFSGTGGTCSSTPCALDIDITPGGTAKYMVVCVTGTI